MGGGGGCVAEEGRRRDVDNAVRVEVFGGGGERRCREWSAVGLEGYGVLTTVEAKGGVGRDAGLGGEETETCFEDGGWDDVEVCLGSAEAGGG